MVAHPITCELCRTGIVTWSAREIILRQWSDRGYVRFHATLPVGKCAQCLGQSFDAESDAILDAAFQCEYNKLR